MPREIYVTVGALVGLLALEAGAESLLTLWSRAPRAALLTAGVALYACVGLVFAAAKRYSGRNLTVLNALWQMGNLSVVTLIGVLAFGDALTVAQWVGICLALAASVCFFF